MAGVRTEEVEDFREIFDEHDVEGRDELKAPLMIIESLLMAIESFEFPCCVEWKVL